MSPCFSIPSNKNNIHTEIRKDICVHIRVVYCALKSELGNLPNAKRPWLEVSMHLIDKLIHGENDPQITFPSTQRHFKLTNTHRYTIKNGGCDLIDPE